MEEKFDIVEYLKSLGVGLRPMDDQFFEEGDELCNMYTRMGIIDIDQEDFCHQVVKKFRCEVPNCVVEFDNVLSYELHYNNCHRYSCVECKKHLPSPHILDLHISETHDSYFKALAEKKPMYKCFVEECTVVSRDSKERRAHCIDIHKYPHDFKFDCGNRKPSTKKKATQKTTTGDTDKQTDKKTNGKQTAKKVSPFANKHFSFGHTKAGLAFKHPKEKKESKPIQLNELMESLPTES